MSGAAAAVSAAASPERGSEAMSAQPEFRRVDLPENANLDRAIHRVAESVHRLNEAVSAPSPRASQSSSSASRAITTEPANGAT